MATVGSVQVLSMSNGASLFERRAAHAAGSPVPQLILTARTRSADVHVASDATSVHWVTRGEAELRSGAEHFATHHGAFVVLDRPWSLTIDAHQPVDVFSAVFSHGFVADVLRRTPAWSDADVAPRENGLADAHEQLVGVHPTTVQVDTALRRVQRAATVEMADAEEALRALVLAMAGAMRLWLARAERVTAQRTSTRDDIVRRVLKGRSHIETHLLEPLSLRNIARAAAMSPFHFHRSFVDVLGETPLDYTIRRRLAVASDLLAATDGPIRDIAFAAGFSSATSFCAVFAKYMGCCPTSFRRGCVSGVWLRDDGPGDKGRTRHAHPGQGSLPSTFRRQRPGYPPTTVAGDRANVTSGRTALAPALLGA